MQYTNIIGIDPSLSCTGLVINNKQYCITNEKTSLTKTKSFNKWFDLSSPFMTTIIIPNNLSELSNFSDGEIKKLIYYDIVTDTIIDTIFKNIHYSKNYNTVCLIEGYSYGSINNSKLIGPLIDLVTFSTLLRNKIIKNKIELHIIPPASLKMYAAKLTYDPIDVGKRKSKLEWRNKEGISGGRFKKPEMYKALIENNKLNNDWVNFLREHASDILNMNNIPKPIDDINDAQILYEIYPIL